MAPTTEGLAERLQRLEERMDKHDDHLASMNERTASMLATERLILVGVSTLLVSAITAAIFIGSIALRNDTSIEALREAAAQHTEEGHPVLRSDVSSLRASVNAVNNALDRLSSEVNSYHRSTERMIEEALRVRRARAERGEP